MLSNRFYSLFPKFSIAALALAALVWSAPVAQAGAIRYAGKMIMQGTNAAAAATASGGEAAADKATSVAKAAPGALGSAASATGNAVVSAGKVAGNGVEVGASAVVSGARQASGIIARNTSAGAKSLWHVIW
ncbi:MAG: hypothetical protein M1423_07025 [Acidobacteria bacterium]|nr:hypothetical protein [Acidobacteriota bacterium]